MNFYSIAIKNVKNKFGSYMVYFVSTLISVIIFNLFCSIYYNPTFQKFRFGTGKMSVLFKGIAVIVLIFSAIFVLYSNDYFIKTRKKEIALYSLLGLKKTQIASLMFCETLIIGVLATAFGTLVGSLSASYFTSLLMKFMGAGTNVKFAVDIRAIIVTVVGFLVLFCISGIRSYRTIYKYKLIDLLNASKKGESLPKYSVFGGILSIVMIAVGYFISTRVNMNVGGMKLMVPAFLVAIIVCIGSYLLFRNFIPMILVFLKNKKSVYYKTSNIISISQISYRVKANAKMLCVVSILCATTVTMISASYSLYRGLEDMVDFYAPYSYLCKNITDKQHDEILEKTKEIGDVSIVNDDKIELVNVKIQDDKYQPDENTKLGDSADCYVLSESMYKTIIEHTDAKKGSFNNVKTDFEGGLKSGECYFLDHNSDPQYCKNITDSDINVTFNNENEVYKVAGAAIHKYIGLAYNSAKSTIVLSDEVYNNYISKASENEIVSFYGFLFDNAMESEDTVKALNELTAANAAYPGIKGNVNYIEFYKSSFALFGSYVFIGLFIGILFLLAVGSVLYYKLIIEAWEEAPRYLILRKTGMKNVEIRASIFKQLGMVYGTPLLLGLLHTFFALLTYNRAMDTMGQETPTLYNAALIVGVYVVTYGGFYVLSVWNYYRIVMKRK